MKQRNKRAEAAQQTLEILNNGFYQIDNDPVISIQKELDNCVKNAG